jgi:hypothetical protein
VRAFFKLVAVVSEDLDQLENLLEGAWVIDDSSESSTGRFASHSRILATEEEDYLVPLGDVSAASYVVILAYQEVEVKLNGAGGPSTTLRPKLASEDPSAVLSEAQRHDRPGFLVVASGLVSSIHITNPSTTETARIFAAAVGNAQ